MGNIVTMCTCTHACTSLSSSCRTSWTDAWWR